LDALTNSRIPRRPITRHRDPQRSRITNGSLLPAHVDERTAWARRAKDIIAEHVSDLGGIDNTSAAERSLIRRVSVLVVELERLEAKFAASDEASPHALDLYVRGSGSLRRLLQTLGLQRRSRDVTPTLAEVLREHQHDAVSLTSTRLRDEASDADA
jgi:hypothetical protein